MTDHNREEREARIKQAETAIHRAFLKRGGYRGAAEAAFAVFEQAHTPTDDERERIEQSNDIAYTVIEVAQNKAPEEFVTLDFRYGIADALWDAGYRKTRRTVQGEPTDAQVLAGLNAEQAHDRQVNGMRPVVEESKSLDDWHSLNIERMRAVLRAAINETGEGRG